LLREINDLRDEKLGVNDIVIATSEKTDSLLRNGATWMQESQVIVVDEVHLLILQIEGQHLKSLLQSFGK